MATNDKRTLLTEIPKAGVYPDIETFNKLESERQKRDKELITDAVTEITTARDKALLNAHDALVNAFGPKMAPRAAEKLAEAMEDKVASIDYITECDIDTLLAELENAPEDDDMVQECRKRLDECKDPAISISEKEKMYRDIHRKFWAYVQSLPARKTAEISTPSDTDKAVKAFMSGGWKSKIHWISYEGSMIICSLIAVSDGDSAWINLGQLPEEDKNIIRGISNKTIDGFRASFDQYKNFDCETDTAKDIKFILGNRVASIPPNETRIGSDVKVEKKGRDIVIGDRIKLEKNRIQNLVAPPDSTNNGANRGGFVPRQKVSGRNAYEIRADVLEMALDWAKNSNDKKLDTDDVLDIAESFYSFVEHK